MNEQIGRRPAAALAVTCIPAFMVALDLLVVTIALATIRTSLDASVEALGWTVNAYTLAFGVLILPGALLGDRLGRRRMFVAGLVVFTAASAACALAPTAGALIAARAVQGAGAALVTPLSLALVTAAFPAGGRGKVIGIWSAVTGSAVALGPLVGGLVVEGASWPWIFWLNVPIGVAAIVAAPRMLSESRGTPRPIDLPGLLLAAAGLLALVWGIIRGNQQGWSSAEILVSLIGGGVLLAAFTAWQLRARTPLLPRRLFADRVFVAANVSTFLLTASLMGAAFLVPQYLQTALGHSVLGTGALMLPWTAAPMLVTPIAGALADRVGNRPLMMTGLALQGAAFLWIAAVAGPDTGYGALVVPLLFAGVGISLVFPAVTNAVVGGVRPGELGMASAVNTAFRQIGGPLGVAVAVAVFQETGGFAGPQAFADGLAPALAVVGAISLAGVLVAATARRTPAPAPSPTPTPTPRPASRPIRDQA